MEKTVSTKQFAIIIFIIATSSKIFMLPGLILGISGRDSWLTLFAYFAIEMTVLSLVLAANKKNPDISVYEFLYAATGKVISKVILLTVITFYLFKMTVMISEIKVFFTITATENLSWQLCVIPFLAMLGIISLKSLRGIGRISEVFIPFILLSFVIMGLIMVKNTDFTNMLPFFENGVKDNFYSFIQLPIWLTDLSVLTVFLGKIEHRKQLTKASLIACILSFVSVLYFNIIMYSTYSYSPKLLGYGHNITNMVLYPTGTYNYGRFDIVMFSIWMIGVLIHIATLFYAACRHLTNVTNIKNNYVTALINIAILFVLIIYVFPDEQLLYSYSVSAFNYVAFVVEIMFPLLIYIGSSVYKRKFTARKSLLNPGVKNS